MVSTGLIHFISTLYQKTLHLERYLKCRRRLNVIGYQGYCYSLKRNEIACTHTNKTQMKDIQEFGGVRF